MSIDAIKKKLGFIAAEQIEENQLVGLGTGSTAYFFIERLGERCRDGLSVQAIASSTTSLNQAKTLGIPLADMNTLTSLDITVDGADEIDPKNQLIKGGGGALLREKIIATMSRKLLIIVDETKVSQRLGHKKIPVEIVPFAHIATAFQIKQLGLHGAFRQNPDGTLFITDNHNFIFDITLPSPTDNPQQIHNLLMPLPGVVETGLFLNLATHVLIGEKNGHIIRR